MRGTKLRAWDKKAKEYRALDAIYFDKDGQIESVTTRDIETGRDPWYRTIEEVVLERYTGFKDRNGKEIWEGDIIYSGEISWEVIWEEWAQCFYAGEMGGAEHYDRLYDVIESDSEHVEVEMTALERRKNESD